MSMRSEFGPPRRAELDDKPETPSVQRFSYPIELCGSWTVDFDPASAGLKLRHDTGASVSGELAFGRDDAAWRIGSSRDGVDERLALIDADGDVQGYLHFVAQGARLEVLVHHRAAQSYAGTLDFQGIAVLGKNSFACRTTPPESESAAPLALSCDLVDQVLTLRIQCKKSGIGRLELQFAR